MITNMSLAIFLINPAVRCISVAYDKQETYGKTVAKDVKSFKSLDRAIKKGDLVVVPTDTRWGYTVGRVEDVDLNVDYGSNETMRWIASVVDKDFIESVMKSENEMIAQVHASQVEAQRRELAAQLQSFNPNLGGNLLANMGAVQSKSNLAAETPPRPSANPHPAHTYKEEPAQRGGAQKSSPDDEIPF